MDIKTLTLFQHLANSLNFTRTAEAMYVSPSTLSRAIQRLEEDCGAALFIRDNRTVKLTAIGVKMLQFCDKFITDWQQLKQQISAQNEALHGELSIFCSVTASISHLPALLDGFQTKYPQVEIKLITGDPAEAERRIVSKNVDLGIAIHTPNFPKELFFHEIGEIPLVLVVPQNFAHSHWQEIDWQDTPVILPKSGPSKWFVHNWFEQQKLKPSIYASVAGNEAIISMVALGCGVGIVPDVVVNYSVLSNKVKCIDIPNHEPYRLGLSCLNKRTHEAAIHAFIGQSSN